MLSHVPHKRFYLFSLSAVGWGGHFRGAVKAEKSRFLSLLRKKRLSSVKMV